jgi:hypothetical protein
LGFSLFSFSLFSFLSFLSCVCTHIFIYTYFSPLHLYLLFRSLSPIFLLWIPIWVLNKTLPKNWTNLRI